MTVAITAFAVGVQVLPLGPVAADARRWRVAGATGLTVGRMPLLQRAVRRVPAVGLTLGPELPGQAQAPRALTHVLVRPLGRSVRRVRALCWVQEAGEHAHQVSRSSAVSTSCSDFRTPQMRQGLSSPGP